MVLIQPALILSVPEFQRYESLINGDTKYFGIQRVNALFDKDWFMSTFNTLASVDNCNVRFFYTDGASLQQSNHNTKYFIGVADLPVV